MNLTRDEVEFAAELGGGGRVSAVTPTVRLPHLDVTGRVTFPRVLLSEWTKLRSVRSTKWSLGVGFLLTIVFPVLFSFVTRSHWSSMSPGDRAGRHPLDIALAGVNVAQLAIAVLGVLLISAEYSTGSIRSTFTAVPKRLPVLWAKLIDYAVVSLVLMVPAVLVSFFASQAILNSIPQLQISFTQPGVARAVIGGAVYVMLVGIFALAIGAIVRNTAGGIAAFAAIFFVLPPLMFTLPTNWNNAISQYLPSEAGRQLFALQHASHTLTPLAGGLVFVGYCAAAIVIAAVLLRPPGRLSASRRTCLPPCGRERRRIAHQTRPHRRRRHGLGGRGRLRAAPHGRARRRRAHARHHRPRRDPRARAAPTPRPSARRRSELRQGLHITNTDIGLLVAVSSLVGAVATLPFGVLADRVTRTRVLGITIVIWGAAMLWSATVPNFHQLLLARLFLGAVTASAGPLVASLVGDWFGSWERGRIYGVILAGEYVGAGIGFAVTGNVAALSWRAAFVILALPGVRARLRRLAAARAGARRQRRARLRQGRRPLPELLAQERRAARRPTRSGSRASAASCPIPSSSSTRAPRSA